MPNQRLARRFRSTPAHPRPTADRCPTALCNRHDAAKPALAFSIPLRQLQLTRNCTERLFMRKWHRWLSVFFGLFLFFIATTGLLSHAADLWPAAEPTAAQIAAQTPPAGWECPPRWRCRAPEAEGGFASYKGFFHHLHSGEEFGLPGVILSIASGVALLFFALSGLWMYVRMWRDRARRGATDRWFWK